MKNFIKFLNNQNWWEGNITEFIFMLTQHDVTVPNALEVLEEVKDTGLRCVGCKDIGLSLYQYTELFHKIRKYGMTSFLEVVTYNEEEHFRDVNLALKVDVDNLIGGMPRYTEKTLEYLRNKGSKLKVFSIHWKGCWSSMHSTRVD
jgi:hypothetical protein